ncbi:flagellar export chaperone FliS [Alkalihalobacillus sp. MEB130]|uniref:flagellar export chaperone FliS n=1 Tax=Alkalihalobacillus sp. MEB130 TaxID=2976704 RepID=UPI0028DDD5C6|nr:flagellar export chaperone FliS [Alkalihalobacillus sp. MEB130]MDT8861684.1 flagellar export chaperone FliS [Alkalihalobacillus sp. MEB130]
MTTILSNETLYQKSSQELTALLYEACVTNLEEAISHIEEKNFSAANEKLKKTSDIVHRLGAGLNYSAGIIADQLEQVYNYIADKLVEANIKKDTAIIKEIISLISMIMSSWNESMKTKPTSSAKGTKAKVNAYETNSLYES